jgi:hypothetical protein
MARGTPLTVGTGRPCLLPNIGEASDDESVGGMARSMSSMGGHKARHAGGRDRAVALLAGSAGAFSVAELAVAQPAAVTLIAAVGLAVGAATQRTLILGTATAGVAVAINGPTHPGTLAGPGSTFATLLLCGFVMSLALFLPGWFLGAAIRTRRAGAVGAGTYAAAGFAVLAVICTCVLVLFIILIRGGGCCA